MKNSIHLAGKLGLIAALTATLAGCVTEVRTSPEVRTVYVPTPAPEPYTPPSEPPPVDAVQPAPVIEPAPVYQPAPVVIQAPQPVAEVPAVIQTEADFNQPLAPYGEWVVVQGYGRCWRPQHVDVSWRPYSEGRWQWTDAGWYWASDEPWGWATYHYGRWDWTPQYGWIWAPQTQWAPAWVTWREGAGYVGWAPLPPTARISVNGSLEISVAIPGARFCFIDTPHLLHPIRHDTVIVNNTTIVNRTVNVTKVKVVNHVVINEGPRTDNIERATGQPLRQNLISEVRQRDEAQARERSGRDHLTANPATPAARPQLVSAPAPALPHPQVEPVRTLPTRPVEPGPQRGGFKPEKAEPSVALNNTPAPERRPAVEPPSEKQTPPPVERQSPRRAAEKNPGQPVGPAPVQSTLLIQPVSAVKAPAPQTGHGPNETQFKSPKETSSKKDKEKSNGNGQDKNEDKNQDKGKQRKGD
jgi:hypothetical protein